MKMFSFENTLATGVGATEKRMMGLRNLRMRTEKAQKLNEKLPITSCPPPPAPPSLKKVRVAEALTS
jgi:hypothetical protein